MKAGQLAMPAPSVRLVRACILVSLFLVALSACRTTSGSTESSLPQVLSVCEALEEKHNLVGERISIRGRVPNLAHGTGIFDSGCVSDSGRDALIVLNQFNSLPEEEYLKWGRTLWNANSVRATFTGLLVFNEDGDVTGFDTYAITEIEKLN